MPDDIMALATEIIEMTNDLRDMKSRRSQVKGKEAKELDAFIVDGTYFLTRTILLRDWLVAVEAANKSLSNSAVSRLVDVKHKIEATSIPPSCIKSHEYIIKSHSEFILGCLALMGEEGEEVGNAHINLSLAYKTLSIRFEKSEAETIFSRWPYK